MEPLSELVSPYIKLIEFSVESLRHKESSRTEGLPDSIDVSTGYDQRFLEVSGRKLHEAKAGLKALRAEQRKLESRLTVEAKPGASKNVGREPRKFRCAIDAQQLEELFGALSNSRIAVIYQGLFQDALSASLWIERRARKLIRLIGALKRAFRQRESDRFCGFDSLKKIWFLMHGSNPPPTELRFTLDSSFGMARN